MLQCNQCNEQFSTSIKINGVKHILKNRRYCLKCSPFKQHNTRRLHRAEELKAREVVCNSCQRQYIYNRKSGGTLSTCNSCNTKQRLKKMKERAIKYKGGKCTFCGYSKCTMAMVFHHLNPNTKDFLISSNYNRAWEDTKAELDKCILLCSNCHAEEHDKLDN